MFPPNHPHYGTIRRRSRCPTGNKRIGLIAVIGICIFLCGLLIAFDTTHDQHILKGIGTQHIPYPIYPHSEPNEEHLAVEDPRRLSGVPPPGSPTTPLTKEQQQLKKQYDELQELIRSVKSAYLKHHPLYTIVLDSFRHHGENPAEYFVRKRNDERDESGGLIVLPLLEVGRLVENWMLEAEAVEMKAGAAKMNKLYEDYAHQSVETLRKAMKLETHLEEAPSPKDYTRIQQDVRRVTENLESLQNNWKVLATIAVQQMNEDEKSEYIIELTGEPSL